MLRHAAIVVGSAGAGGIVAQPDPYPLIGAIGGAFAVVFARPWMLLGGAIAVRMFVDVTPRQTDPLTVSDLLFLAWIVRQSIDLLRRRTFALAPSAWVLTALVAWGLVATMHSGVTLSPWLRITVYAVSGVLLAAWPRDVVKLYAVVSVGAAVQLVMASPALLRLEHLGDENVGDPHQFGMLMIAGAVPLMASVYRGRWMRSLWRWGTAAALLLGAFLTYRRAIWLALAVMGAVALLRGADWRRVVAIVVLATVAALGAFNAVTRSVGLNPHSYAIRQESIARGIDTGEANLGFGTGWAGVLVEPLEQSSGELTPDDTAIAYNLFVGAFASLGLVGVGLLVAFFALAIKEAGEANRAALLYLAAFLSVSLSSMTWFASSLMTMIFFVYAATASTRPTASGASTSSPGWARGRHSHG